MFGLNNIFNAAANAMAAAQQQAMAQQQLNLPPFKKNYRCFPVVMANKPNLECGDKIILPPTALDHLARLRVTYPMMFSITNKKTGKTMHCGVLEFSGEEGVAYIPYWMMQNLLLESGAIIEISNVTLPKGTFVKLQPHTTKFTQLYNPRVVLEQALRNFSCLTTGDTIAIQHGEENYYLDIVEVKPGNAITIVETDVNVDFAPPKDYKESDYKKPSSNTSSPAIKPTNETEKSTGFSIKTEDSETKTDSKTSANNATVSANKNDYFAKLGGGHKLSGKSTSSPATKPTGTNGNSMSSLSLTAQTTSNTDITTPTPALPTSREVIETQGQWDFVYSVDGSGKKKLLRRMPHKPKATIPAGGGYSLK